MTEPRPLDSLSVAALRERINDYPPYAGAEIEVTHIADDGSELRVQMPLTERNQNLVGTQFGGSLYAMVDPHLMILLMLRLGAGYVVWDQAASIEFVRPGRSRVHAVIRVTDGELAAIREATGSGDKHLPQWELEILDAEDQVVARVRKTLYVRRAV